MIPQVPLVDTSTRVGFAFGAGMVAFFAPCAYPLLPGYVAFFLGDGEEAAAASVGGRLLRAGYVGGLASVGFLLVYGVVVGVAAALGTRALRDISVLELVVGSLMVVLGGVMASGRITPAALHVQLPERRRSGSGYFLFGVVYAAAAAGCTAPIFLAVVGLSLTGGPLTAVSVLGAYALGMSLMMVTITTVAALGRESLLRPLAARTGLLTRLGGVALVLAGLVQIYWFLFRFGGTEILGLT